MAETWIWNFDLVLITKQISQYQNKTNLRIYAVPIMKKGRRCENSSYFHQLKIDLQTSSKDN